MTHEEFCRDYYKYNGKGTSQVLYNGEWISGNWFHRKTGKSVTEYYSELVPRPVCSAKNCNNPVEFRQISEGGWLQYCCKECWKEAEIWSLSKIKDKWKDPEYRKMMSEIASKRMSDYKMSSWVTRCKEIGKRRECNNSVILYLVEINGLIKIGMCNDLNSRFPKNIKVIHRKNLPIVMAADLEYLCKVLTYQEDDTGEFRSLSCKNTIIEIMNITDLNVVEELIRRIK